MEENFILNDGPEQIKLGRKEKKELEKKKKQKEKKIEKEIKKNKEIIKKKEKEKKREEIKEKNIKKKKSENNKTPAIFSKNLRTKKKIQEKNEEDSSEEVIEENSGIAPKSKKSKLYQNENFENSIIKAYEKLSSFYNSKKNEKIISDKEYDPQLISILRSCEKKLRNALNILKKDKNIILNRNILDKFSRLIENDKINLNYIIGEIYMILMKRGKIFNFRDKNFENNDLVYFTNKVIQLKEILINTRIGIYYKRSLIKYLNYIKKEFKFEEDQLKIINQVLEENKDIEHKLKLQKDFDDLVYSLSDGLIKQNNSYEQYNILIQNKKIILGIINNIDIKSQENYTKYLELGKILSYLLFNKSFRIYLNEPNGEDSEFYETSELFGYTGIFFDGLENKKNLGLINSENYLIDYDDEIEELREKICDIIIAFCKKFISLENKFSIQYIIYTLIKRIFFCHYKNFENISERLLAKSLVNLCFFEESIELVNYFINKIIKSEEEQNLKNIIINEINERKEEEGFLYNYSKLFIVSDEPNQRIEEEKLDKEEKIIEENTEEEESQSQSQIESEYEDDEYEIDSNDKIQRYYKVNSEILFILDKDLKINFFNIQVIKQGEKFIFYEELHYSYGILDFCMYIKELDINLKIIDVTEGKIILEKKGIDQLLHCPFKLILFFSSPRIIKFEIDNSFSWFTSKTIRYKTNILYPGNPYLIGNKILLNNYKNEILKGEKIINKKIKKEDKMEMNNNVENLLITKINGENKVFNTNNVKKNLKEIKKMIKNKELNILSVFIEINKDENASYFFYNDKEKGFIKNKLEKETFEEHIYNLVRKFNNANLNIINLYVINGDIDQEKNNIKQSYSKYPIKKILNFEPLIKNEGIIQKILFFIQDLNEAQLLYYLYEQNIKNEAINKIFLLNFTKNCGYQTALFNNGEINLNPIEFNGINKDKSIEDNINIILNGIKSVNAEENNLIILLTKSIEEDEQSNNCDKIEEILSKQLENKNNIKIEKLDSNFNEAIEINSHVFYLDN